MRRRSHREDGRSKLDAITGRRGELFVVDVPGVSRGGGLEDQDFNLFISDCAMLHTARHDQKLALAQLDRVIAELDAEPSAPDQEQLVLIRVVMPDEVPLEFHEFDLLTVQFADSLRPPVLANQTKLFRELYPLKLPLHISNPV